MKRGWKIFWIVSAAIAGMGIILCSVSLMLGFSIEGYRTAYPDGIGIIKRGYHLKFDEEATGDTAEVFRGIREISIDTDKVVVYVLADDTLTPGEVRVETAQMSGLKRNHIYKDEEELKIEIDRKYKVQNDMEDAELYVYIAKEENAMEELDVKVGIGVLYIEDIDIRDMEIDASAGEAEVTNVNVNSLDAKAGAGEIVFSGSIRGEADVECTLGRVELNLQNAKEEYDYELKCGLGQVNIGEEKFGPSVNKKIYNQAGKTIEAECGLGEVRIDFEK